MFFELRFKFQKRNTNQTIDQGLNTVEEIQNLSIKKNKQLVVYLSMAYGNPYEESYHPDIVAELTEKLNSIDIKTISLSDTIGASNARNITNLFKTLIPEYPSIEFGAHFHSTPNEWYNKIKSAYLSGCNRFDSTIMGYGGCPMALNKLIGNIPTEKLINFFNNQENDIKLNFSDFKSGGSKFLKFSWHFKTHRFSKFLDFQNYQIFKPF